MGAIIATATVPAHARLSNADTVALPTGHHPDWEIACLPGDTPLHLSREWAVTVPAGFRDKTTQVSAQVQSSDDGPAEVYLQGGNDIALSPEHAEQYAAAILAAAALARRDNATRTEAAA